MNKDLVFMLIAFVFGGVLGAYGFYCLGDWLIGQSSEVRPEDVKNMRLGLPFCGFVLGGWLFLNVYLSITE